ncbi:MAG: hypothetical protein HOY71_33405, partial [Nonomuraea sp.]|nr:hypothetical protein [Nonomuraea sp.]
MNEGLVADPVERTARGERGLMNGSRCLLAAVGVLALVLAAGAVAGAAWWENGRRSGSDRVEIAGRAADRAQ